MIFIQCQTCKMQNEGKFVGQAFTEYVCKACEQVRYHYNTNTPDYCEECALAEDICQRCGEYLEKGNNE